MFQPFKGKQNLGVFKAVLKLASSQLRLSMQIWAGSTKEILNSFPPSARFSTFSCARSVLRVVLLLKDLYIHIFKNSPYRPAPSPDQGASLSLCYSSSLVLSTVCSFYGPIHWAPARLSDKGGNPGCRWLETWPGISMQLMNDFLYLTPTSHQVLNTIWASPARETIVCTSASRSSQEADGKAIDRCKSNVIRKGVLHWKRQSGLVKA